MKRWIAIALVCTVLVLGIDLVAWIAHLTFAETGVCILIGMIARQIVDRAEIE